MTVTKISLKESSDTFHESTREKMLEAGPSQKGV
jgi:hypothetical protein